MRPPDVVVTGFTKPRSNTSRIASSSSTKRSRREAGSAASETGGTHRARAVRQNGVAVKVSFHHARHRANVRRLAPIARRSSAARRAFAPCLSAVTSATTAPR